MDERPITKIDIEKVSKGLHVRYWMEGWIESAPSPADREETVTVDRIEDLLRKFEREGFTVEMCDSYHGRALRGKITRIDFSLQVDGWHINKYPYGWTAKTRPLSEKVVQDAEDAIKWCEENGWNVRRWPNGARAFKGEPLPVRDAFAIASMRKRVEQNFNRGVVDMTNKRSYNFAFDY